MTHSLHLTGHFFWERLPTFTSNTLLFGRVHLRWIQKMGRWRSVM